MDVAKLNKESQARLDVVNAAGKLDLSVPLRELRANSNRCDAELKGDFVFPGTAEEKMISSVDGDVEYLIPVTILRPQGGVWKNIMIYFHGGGWTWGSRKSHMKLCEMISQ